MKTSGCWWLPVFVPLLACCPPARSRELAAEFTVRVYDYAGISLPDLERARDVAGLPFRRAGVHMVWWNCGAPPSRQAPDPQCHALPLESHDLQVNIVEHARALKIGPNKLGASVLSREHDRRGPAYVFANRIRALARQLSSPRTAGELLGYSVAHELGHLLLGQSHSTAGIMRPTWNAQQMQAAFSHMLWFHPAEAARMRETLARREPESTLATLPAR